MTVFEKFKKDVTQEELANLMVKTVLVNKNELFYMTSTGQLFNFTLDGLKKAIEYQNSILSQETDIEKEKS